MLIADIVSEGNAIDNIKNNALYEEELNLFEKLYTSNNDKDNDHDTNQNKIEYNIEENLKEDPKTKDKEFLKKNPMINTKEFNNYSSTGCIVQIFSLKKTVLKFIVCLLLFLSSSNTKIIEFLKNKYLISTIYSILLLSVFYFIDDKF